MGRIVHGGLPPSQSGDEPSSAQSIALASRLEELEDFYSHAPCGFHSLDGQGRFIRINDTELEWLGYSRDEVLGRNFTEFLTAAGLATFRREFPVFTERGWVRDLEVELVRKDGSAFSVLVNGTAIRALDGSFVASRSILLDITERKAEAALLQRTKDQLEAAQELAGIGSWEWDAATDRFAVSKEIVRFLGQAPNDKAEALRLLQVVSPEDRQRIVDALVLAMERSVPYELEYRMRNVDGRDRIVSSRCRAVPGPGGRAVKLSGTVQDITELRRMEEQLALAGRMATLGTLAAGVAHEINNPLTYVMANLQVLAESLPDALLAPLPGRFGELKEMLDEAQHGVERIRRVVRGMGCFGGAEPERIIELDLGPILDEAAILSFSSMPHPPRLRKEYGPTPQVRGDESRLERLFAQLLLNAAEAMTGDPAHGEITVTTRTDEGGRAVVEVQDMGRGISSAIQDRIFDPFFTTKPLGSAMGLGLSICHAIAKAHGGDISFESQPARGSVFRVVLPAACRAVKQKAAAATATPTVGGRRGEVLVVDDEPAIARVIRRVLSEHQVTMVESVDQALELIRGGCRYDVIFCDVVMPERSGLELHGELSRDFPEQAERLVIMTGQTRSACGDRELELKTPLLQKPFGPEQIRQLARKLIG